MEKKIEIATLAGGCFWCLEAIYKKVKGVVKVVPGSVEAIQKTQIMNRYVLEPPDMLKLYKSSMTH